jgi:ATP-dependent Clp protease adaptor protein ClpS
MSAQHRPHEESDAAVVDQPKTKEPRQYAVILHNDDYTTMEFVVEVLTRFFRKTHEEALAITLQVHKQGRGVAGIYSFEIAETKAFQVTELAQSRGHPLKCTTEAT